MKTFGFCDFIKLQYIFIRVNIIFILYVLKPQNEQKRGRLSHHEQKPELKG